MPKDLPVESLNAVEHLDTCVGWFNSQHANLSFGLRSPEDALKLWRYALAHPELAEFCDEPTGEPGDWLDQHYLEAIGYNPWKEPGE